MYAGTKSFFGGHTMTTRGNLLLWPNLSGWGAAAMLYAAVANASGYDEFWTNNTVVLGAATAATHTHSSSGPCYLDMQPCDIDRTSSLPSLHLADNTLFVPSDNVAAIHCGKGHAVTFADWQRAGHDVGSKLHVGVPTDDAIVQKAKALLGLDQ